MNWAKRCRLCCHHVLLPVLRLKMRSIRCTQSLPWLPGVLYHGDTVGGAAGADGAERVISRKRSFNWSAVFREVMWTLFSAPVSNMLVALQQTLCWVIHQNDKVNTETGDHFILKQSDAYCTEFNQISDVELTVHNIASVRGCSWNRNGVTKVEGRTLASGG